MAYITEQTPINGATETTTSSAINIEKAEKVTFMFTRANHSSGSSAFKVSVSLDGTTYVDYNKLIDNLENTNAQDLTRITTKTLSADGSATCSMDLTHDAYKWMKVVATETTDGTHTAKALIQYKS